MSVTHLEQRKIKLHLIRLFQRRKSKISLSCRFLLKSNTLLLGLFLKRFRNFLRAEIKLLILRNVFGSVFSEEPPYWYIHFSRDVYIFCRYPRNLVVRWEPWRPFWRHLVPLITHIHFIREATIPLWFQRQGLMYD